MKGPDGSGNTYNLGFNGDKALPATVGRGDTSSRISVVSHNRKQRMLEGRLAPQVRNVILVQLSQALAKTAPARRCALW